MISDRCIVETTGEPKVIGPTPVDAPYLANGLAAYLLRKRERVTETVRFTFHTPQLLTFSWELSPDVLKKLAGPVEFVLNTDKPLRAHEAKVRLKVFTGMTDPATLELGVEPTEIIRAGETISPWPTTGAPSGSWSLEMQPVALEELSTSVRELCARAPSPTLLAALPHKVRVSISVRVDTMRGGFSLDADAICKLAALRVPLAIFLFNYSA